MSVVVYPNFSLCPIKNRTVIFINYTTIFP